MGRIDTGYGVWVDINIMSINICMVTWNRLELTRRAIESLLAKTAGDFTLHVVDNASTDGTQDYLEELAARHGNVRLFLLRRNMGVSVGANMGWGAQDADYYVKLDNDIEILDPDWLQNLVSLLAANPELGMVAHLSGDWPYEITQLSLGSGDILDASACCNGGCVMIPRRTHEKLGFWNEDYGLYGFEDLEYSERAALAGMICGYVPKRGMVGHLGYAPGAASPRHEASKGRSIESHGRAEKLFVLNRFLFSRGLRPLYMGRKYLPEVHDGQISFRTNADVMPILKLQEELLQKISYEVTPEGVSIDAASLRLLSEL